jgi:hypothetical protein
MKSCCHSNADCKIRAQKGKGSFFGYRLMICFAHQIIVSMKKVTA